MTPGEVIEAFRQIPDRADLIESCYLEADLLRAARRFHGSEEFHATIKHLHTLGVRGRRLVLDMGGGRGTATLAWLWSGHDVVLLEPDPSEVVGLGALARLVRTEGLRVRMCRAVGEDLPFPDNTFDLVYGRQVLHHSSDLAAMCKEIYRVLKPHGLFFAAREHVISKKEDLEEFLAKHPIHRFTGGENAYRLNEYLRAFKDAGFRKVVSLGSWQTVINYFPVTEQQFLDSCRHTLVKRAGTTLGRLLLSRPAMRSLLGWHWSRQDHMPGRMFTFIAKKRWSPLPKLNSA